MGLKWYGNEAKRKMNFKTVQALTESINLVDRDIKNGTPVRTGILRNNNIKEVQESRLVAREVNNTEYAPNIEFGTRYQKAQPFFRIGFLRNVKNIINIFKKRGMQAIGN